MDNHEKNSDLTDNFGVFQAQAQHAATKDAFHRSNHFQSDMQSDLSGVFDDNFQALQDWIDNLDATVVSPQGNNTYYLNCLDSASTLPRISE